MNILGSILDIIVSLLHATYLEQKPKVLYVLSVTLMVAIIFPMAIVLASLSSHGNMTLDFVKLIMAISVTTVLFLPPGKARVSATLIAIPLVIILILGIFETTKSIAIALGLIIDTIAVLIIGIFAYILRFSWAFVEAPSTEEDTIAQAENKAKMPFRVALAIVAFEWFAAGYLVIVSPLLTITMGIIAMISLGVMVLSAYSLGYKGETGLNILLGSAVIVFLAITLILIDRLIANTNMSQFVLGGYFGQALQNPTMMGLVFWIMALILMYVVGVTIAWILEKEVIAQCSFVLTLLLGVYVVIMWIQSTGFSAGKSIERTSGFVRPYTTRLIGGSSEITTALVAAGVMGVVISGMLTIKGFIDLMREDPNPKSVVRQVQTRSGPKQVVVREVKKQKGFPGWPIAILILSCLILYHLVPFD